MRIHIYIHAVSCLQWACEYAQYRSNSAYVNVYTHINPMISWVHSRHRNLPTSLRHLKFVLLDTNSPRNFSSSSVKQFLFAPTKPFLATSTAGDKMGISWENCAVLYQYQSKHVEANHLKIGTSFIITYHWDIKGK